MIQDKQSDAIIWGNTNILKNQTLWSLQVMKTFS